jgi:enoyl-CoA hydratase/carnithine racemase
VLLLSGEGADFSAGNDLADFAAESAAGSRGAGAALDFLHALNRFDKPVVAAVEGRAIGIGATLLLHCDVVIAARDARLSVPFVDLGLTPEAASSLLLPARVGHARASAMLALGRAIDGQTAADWGLVTDAVEPGAALAAARDAALTLAGKPGTALAVTKRLMRESEALARRIDDEARLFAERLMSPEAAAAFKVFLARRGVVRRPRRSRRRWRRGPGPRARRLRPALARRVERRRGWRPRQGRSGCW